ncbi:MAG: oxidoreductase [Flavobacteriaceae bacterium]
MKKTIVVTGASSGIGKATALQLINEGHTVYGVARRLEKMQDIVTAGGRSLQMDVTDHAQVKEVISTIIDESGTIDVLINNAGYAVYGPVEEITHEQAKRQFDVNMFGLAEVTKAVLPTMRKQQAGTIINISSVGGKIYTPLGAWYHATKHALEGWSDCLRLEVKQFGINVVIVEPGAIKTEFDVAMDHPFGKVGNGPYSSLKRTMEKVMTNAYKPGNYSEPTVIAQEISKAIKAKRPKTRYAAGKMAKQTLMGRKWLSDKGFDKMIMNMMNRMEKA